MLEDLPDGQLGAEAVPDAVDQPCDEQGVTAEAEEVVVGSHVGHAQDGGEEVRHAPLRALGGRRPEPWGLRSGAGSALRAILPLAVSGRVSSTTKAAGTM